MVLPTHQEYSDALADLNNLIGACFEMSVRLTKLTGDTRKQIASVMFAKMNLCALSITKLLPPDSKSIVGETIARERFCDVSSAASLCRDLIEASNRLYYFAVEIAPESEVRMRLKIHEYQVVAAHSAFLNFVNFDVARRDELNEELLNLKKELEQFPEFHSLPKQVRNRILKGKQGEALSQVEIAIRRGREEAAFKADYKYLSSHVHSDAFSLFDLMLGTKAGGPMTEESRERLVTIMREATNYLALTLLDMNTLFPQFKLTDEGLKKARSFVARLL